MSTKNKILYILICLIIIVGVIVWKVEGFNLELQYSSRQQITISNATGINTSDMEEIVSDVLGNKKYFIQKVETFGNSVSIVAESITDEEKTSIIEKFNEKYEDDLTTDEVDTISIPFTRVKDTIKQFILPGVITLVVVLIYFLIRFRKLEWKKILAKTVINPILAELLLYSVIAIFRIPYGRIAIAAGVGLYVITIAVLTNNFEEQRESKIAELQKEGRTE